MAFSKENNSRFFKSNELHSSINFSQIIPEKSRYNNLSLNQHEKSKIHLDPILDYISRCLMEEDKDEINGYQDTALRDMEKPFYDILGEKYPHLPDNQLVPKQSKINPKFTTSVLKDQVGPCMENLLATDQFQRGVEEGLKFLPNHNKLSILQVTNLSLNPTKKCERSSLEFRLGEERESNFLSKSKGKRNTNDGDLDLLDKRNCKIAMVSDEETIRDEMLDRLVLYHGKNYSREEISSLREIKELEANSYSEYHQNKHGHINIKASLISCAMAIYMNDNKFACELIKQIRKEASPIGDGIQRLACILVDGLEARLAGTESATYRQYFTKQVSTNDYMKTIYMCSRVVPVMRVSFHFANESILNATRKASKIHVVDFGINPGFQWPSLIQSLAKRKDGPPNLRITGIDLPQSGFHPAERINKTGRRLEDYARSFGVPFEYQGIASQWEAICIDDLSINDDEVLIVNNIYNLGSARDEPLSGKFTPRYKLLDLIQETKPKLFIQGIFNLSFSPFFTTRFRQVLLQFSRYFDLHDTLLPGDYKHMQLLEREIYGPSIINLIACEGSDLVRPENYKHWHMQNLQSGFQPFPVDPRVVKECRELFRTSYNEAYFVDEECNWFFWGWKGNIIRATSLWKPKAE